MFLRILTYAAFFLLFQNASSENIRRVLFGDGVCKRSEYRCLNGKCIQRPFVCNRKNDCGDNSDESYCNTDHSCPAKYPFRCGVPYRYNEFRCIPTTWKCNGNKDCQDEIDEKQCDFEKSLGISAENIEKAASLSIDWIRKGRKADRKLEKWGLDLPRKAVAFYMYYKSLGGEHAFINEMAYELNSNFLSKAALKKNNLTTSEISSYVNAFLTTCIDPRQFYALDMVTELRRRLNNMNGTNPFAVLTLCNAEEPITERDIQKLKEEFRFAQEKHRIDTMAMIVLAVSCASTQSKKIVGKVELSNLVLELKKLQLSNGTVDNVKSTSLVMQALFAAESVPDEVNFDETKAIKQILQSQDADGSFGNLANTYYALPVLNGLSLVNISSKHCPELIRDDNERLQFLRDQAGEKKTIKYSLWINDDKFIQRTIVLSVPIDTSFYTIMEYASDLDMSYRFKYNMRNQKPFIYSITRFMDDPEKELFWSLNLLINETTMEVKKISQSPADVYPEDKDHLIYWYKTDSKR